MKRLIALLISTQFLAIGCGESLSKTPKKSNGSEVVDTGTNNVSSANNDVVVKDDNAVVTLCGNSQVNVGEDCDGAARLSCVELGFDEGQVSCSDRCTHLTDACVRHSCGDGQLQGEEACDDGPLNGLPGSCNNNCSGITSFCGDGVINGQETCDGDNLGGQSCTSLGFERGVLGCSSCGVDTSGCSTCGDGVVGVDETCDDGALNGTYGHCNASCSQTMGFCGDGLVQPEEECDGSAPAGVSCGSLGLGRGTVSCASTCDLMASCTLAPMGGELIFTEIMADPNASSDNDGEWFEMYNTSGRVVDLSGCLVESSTATGMESFTIVSLVVQPGAYVTLARNTQAPFFATYIYNGGINLNNTTDSLTLICNDGHTNTVVDHVAYDNGVSFPDPTGASLSLNPNRLNASQNDLGSNWCVSFSTFGVGDLGTPGAPNDPCF